MYETLEKKEEELPFHFEKQGNRKFSHKLLTYLDLTDYIALVFEGIKQIHKVFDRLELQPVFLLR